jgi:hypothetical protein
MDDHSDNSENYYGNTNYKGSYPNNPHPQRLFRALIAITLIMLLTG